MLFSFPPEAQSERSAFTVVGQARPGGALAGEVMLVPDEALPEEGFSGCVFYLDERRPARLPVCTRTLIPEALAARFPENPVYLSSDLSCSTLRARLTAAQEAFGGRLWFIIRPLSRFFTLPCPSGEGQRVSPEAEDRLTRLDAPVFSRALCCMYCRAAYCGRDGLYLFDTQESIAEKLRLAEDCGAAHVLLLPPETDVL